MEDFKYIAIVDWAQQRIAEGKLAEGDRFFSEKELCDIHGVSRQTVRQALTVLENRNVIFRKRGSGTFVRAAAPVPVKTGCNVGVVSTYFSDYIFPSIVTGIEKVLKSGGVGMQLAITHNMVSEEADALRSMLASGIRGIIVEPSKSALPSPNEGLYEEIRRLKIPIVFFNAKYPWSSFPCVAMDDVMAGKLITDHLIELGHRKICGIFALDDMQGHNRYRGFIESFTEHRLAPPEGSVLWYSTAEKDWLFDLSRDRILTLLNDCTAAVCYNDSLAVKLLDFCKKQGIRVPYDLSIVGIDDSKLGSVCDVPLTTVHHPHQLLGERTAEKMLEIIRSGESGGETGDELFPTKLIVRSSTAPVGITSLS